MSGEVPPGIVCTPQEYQRSLHDNSITCLSRPDTIGIMWTVVAGMFSLIAILYVVFVIVRNVIWRADKFRSRTIFHHPMDIVMFSLFVADTLQAIGVILSAKWVNDGKVEVGTFCYAEGIIRTLGGTGVALSVIAIAGFTLFDIASMGIAVAFVAAIWTFIVSLVLGATLSNRGQKLTFIAPTPFWCWISGHYMGWRVGSEYLWMWLALLISLVIYLSLWKSWIRSRAGWIMLLYPGVYCLTILPLSVVRWIMFVQEAKYGLGNVSVSHSATFAVLSIFGLGGFFNVILLLKTKPQFGLFGELMFLSPARPPGDEELPVMPTEQATNT